MYNVEIPLELELYNCKTKLGGSLSDTSSGVNSSFSSLVQSLLPKDTLLKTYLTSLQLVTGTVWRR